MSGKLEPKLLLPRMEQWQVLEIFFDGALGNFEADPHGRAQQHGQ
jgi:hypothetical protein